MGCSCKMINFIPLRLKIPDGSYAYLMVKRETNDAPSKGLYIPLTFLHYDPLGTPYILLTHTNMPLLMYPLYML